MDKGEVLKLAKLSRIRISDEEASSLVKDFDAILQYVGQVKQALKDAPDVEKTKEDYVRRNIMRDDENAHESGIYTEELLNAAPKREGQFVKVKKIL
jgi:aspartyl-tRNA(Asn)/glutamyl-tRNA(Gln) amidotransferase subunit C